MFDADNACHCGSCALYRLSTAAAWSLYLLQKASSLVQGDVWKPRWNNYSPCSRIYTSSFVQDSLCTLFGILGALFCVVAVLHCAHMWCNVECADRQCVYVHLFSIDVMPYLESILLTRTFLEYTEQPCQSLVCTFTSDRLWCTEKFVALLYGG